MSGGKFKSLTSLLTPLSHFETGQILLFFFLFNILFLQGYIPTFIIPIYCIFIVGWLLNFPIPHIALI